MSEAQPIFQVLPIAAREWQRYREIRLRALTEAPEAFGSSWANESARPDSVWRERSISTPDRQMWSARRGEGWIGLVGAVREPDFQLQLVSMWVDPGWRRQGVARALIAAVVAWHRLGGSSRLVLWVSSDNPAARLCYESEGFRLTGARLALPPDPTRERLEMLFAEPDWG
ncbi:MAG: GNAT family N-acetyltransferase [Candidatus Dormiibacterota bacterium]